MKTYLIPELVKIGHYITFENPHFLYNNLKSNITYFSTIQNQNQDLKNISSGFNKMYLESFIQKTLPGFNIHSIWFLTLLDTSYDELAEGLFFNDEESNNNNGESNNVNSDNICEKICSKEAR